MGHFSYLLNGLSRSLSIKKGGNCTNKLGKEVSRTMVNDAKKSELILHSSGVVNAEGSKNLLASAYSKRGEKGINQDTLIVLEEYGCQEDMMFCGVFDGHSPWGHFVARHVRESLPSSLLCNWQEGSLDQNYLESDLKDLDSAIQIHNFDLWGQYFVKTCATVDKELARHCKIDCFNSGTTALSIVRQGSDDGSLVPVQLTVDLKPNLPQEAERINQCNRRVFCLDDEPGVHRVWRSDVESLGLAMSRAFGDYCVKDYDVTSLPEVTQRRITTDDQFVVLATDGVWDVISNEEAVRIVFSTLDRGKSSKRLVECAVKAWKRKRKGIAIDDISAICLFFHSPAQLSTYKINPTYKLPRLPEYSIFMAMNNNNSNWYTKSAGFPKRIWCNPPPLLLGFFIIASPLSVAVYAYQVIKSRPPSASSSTLLGSRKNKSPVSFHQDEPQQQPEQHQQQQQQQEQQNQQIDTIKEEELREVITSNSKSNPLFFWSK
ncbi:hypothetical protein MKX03_007629 [Papaver bracteatum]|nr:hypothetical protein MKX03_007629 [Papaver bracteatum]